jgi:hypothetical protein
MVHSHTVISQTLRGRYELIPVQDVMPVRVPGYLLDVDVIFLELLHAMQIYLEAPQLSSTKTLHLAHC